MPFGGSTNLPFGPPNVWITPTEGFPGSPTVAIVTVTTPRLGTWTPSELEVVLVVVPDELELDDEPLEHAVAQTESTTTQADQSR